MSSKLDNAFISAMYHEDMKKRLYTNSELIRGLDYAHHNRGSLQRSVSCGCFNCQNILLANDIRDYRLEEDGDFTAICPYCQEESIIGDDAVYPIKKAYLQELKEFACGWQK